METATDTGDIDSGILLEQCRGTKRKISLTSCGVCGKAEARYRCPRCSEHSCSLPCVKKHKSESGCCGIRDKTLFVPLTKFDDMNLLNDYRFLEDTGRLADVANRDPLMQCRVHFPSVKRLRKQASLAKVTLKILPSTFTKRKENSTYFSKKEAVFYWHLKLMFPQCGSEYTVRRVVDTRMLKDILSAYIHPTESHPVIRQKLKIYVQAPMENVRVFMKSEEGISLRYHELDMNQSLRNNLMNKTIIEYPTLHVALQGCCEEYVTQKQAFLPADACTIHHTLAAQATTDEDTCHQSGSLSNPSHLMCEEELEDGEIQSGEEEDHIVSPESEFKKNTDNRECDNHPYHDTEENENPFCSENAKNCVDLLK
ncbi:box C/D snoRNA protein 1 isoform X2 [Denticeps clupeoides]|uniref:box C/D snoRNA protein 1 isoform X2 n=1 Tax=Denticeps clupeoides TaxID=299321 RepID=UPI0010A373D5|nr:box C/D snoRNA protein 1 isoform X2 [Denticeps clupeoides]